MKNCLTCKIAKATPGKQDIAPLPRYRITKSDPFEICATDFAGPIYIKTTSGTEKAYIVLFTCVVYAEQIAALCDPPLIKLNGDLLKIHTKNHENFRKVQGYLNDNNLKFTTLLPESRCPKKVVVCSMPTYTPFNEFKDRFSLHMAFIAYMQR